MNRLTKKIATALIGLGALSGAINDVQACPGGGGGRGLGGGFGGGFRHGGHHAPVYSQPRYVQPAPQPYYQQPAYSPSHGQPEMGGYGDPGIPQQNPQIAVRPSSNVAPNQLPPTVKKMASVRPSGAARPQLPQGEQFAAQPSGRPMPTQSPNQRIAAQGQQPTGNNPLEALGGDETFQNQPQQGSTGPAPVRQVARRPQSQPAPQAQSESQEVSPMDQAQLSALQALAGFEGEEPQQLESPVEQPEQVEEAESFEEAQPIQAARTTGRPQGQSMHVGQWSASLQNGSKVDLTLQPNGNFTWVATSGEKVSSFEGNYSVSNGSLTLVRSSDNQKLIGSMTPSGSSSFTFKLTGAKDAGLNFSRS